MKLRIDALDTLFFRDGKPFTGGEEAWANMLFPPLPSVLYGALHSAFLAEQIRTWKKKTTEKILNIKAIALESDGSLLFPIPLDCVKPKGDNENLASVLHVADAPQNSNCLIRYINQSTNDNLVLETIEHGFLKSDALSQYLCGQQEALLYKMLSDFMVIEPKVGIKRMNDTHASEEGMLYRVEMRRLQPKMELQQDSSPILSLFVQYIAKYDDVRLPNRGILRLGGEGKAAAYELSNASLPPKPTLTGNRFKLYFATPAIFKQGWRPSWLKQVNENTFQGRYEQLELRLVTAIIGKPLFVGGFDMEQRRPKPMRKAVPAGSIYVFEIPEGKGTIQEAIDTFHGTTISEYDSQQGFGLTFVGGAQ